METKLEITNVDLVHDRLSILTLSNGMLVRCQADTDSLWVIQEILIVNERGEVIDRPGNVTVARDNRSKVDVRGSSWSTETPELMAEVLRVACYLADRLKETR